MGNMTVTLYDENPKPILGSRLSEGDMIPSSSYATGGETLSAGDMGLTFFSNIIGGPLFSNSGTYQAWPIWAGKGKQRTVKFLIVVFATNAQVANAVNLSAEIFRVAALGE